eukprot:Nk52_evm3s2462 gene=Nk52_evmTU3s2462
MEGQRFNREGSDNFSPRDYGYEENLDGGMDIDKSTQDLSSFAMPGLDYEEEAKVEGENSKNESVSDSKKKGHFGTTFAFKPKHTLSPNVNEEVVQDGCRRYCDFLAKYLCYDLVPVSGKIVVFDTHLLVKKAFYALLQNGMRSAPLWSGKSQKFVGMLTITDFINILGRYYQSPLVRMDELEEHKIETWRNMSSNLPESIVSLDPMRTLLDAIRALIEHKIHRLPIIDENTGNPVSIITHKRILNFLCHAYPQEPPRAFTENSIGDLRIGTYDNIACISHDTTLIVVLNIFIERRISALPVADESGKVIDVYAKSDVINLARAGAYNNLDITVKEALEYRAEGFEGVKTCLKTDTLHSIIVSICEACVHRLIVTDTDMKVVGIVSLSDIFKFLLAFNKGNTKPDWYM